MRTYVLSIPAGYDPARRYPLVLGWHGNTWQGASFRNAMAVEQSSAGSAIFVYPDGLAVDGLPTEAAGGVSGTGWDWRANGRDVAFFDAMRTHLADTLCVDSARVFSFGRSHGGFFAHTLACARGTAVRATASVSAGLPSPSARGSCTGPLPVWMAHNADDLVVPISMGEAARDHWRDLNTCQAGTTPVTPAPCQGQLGCPGNPVHFCRSATGGHNPPAFSDAAIWAFFAAF